MKKILILLLTFCTTSLFSARGEARYSPPAYVKPRVGVGLDPKENTQWHLDAIRARHAWALLSANTNSVMVGVIDSGIEYRHPDLRGQIAIKEIERPVNHKDDDLNRFVDDFIGWNFCDDQNMPWDDNGHGTLIAGIIASGHNNGVGGKGICPMCQILPVRFMDKNGYGDSEDSTNGIFYAVKEGARVLNLSFGEEGHDKDLQRALLFAGKKDVVVIIAAGNWEWNNDYKGVYPANYQYPHMLTVAATTQDGKLWEGSAWGKKFVHLGAPGENIFGPYIEKSGWDSGNGTSMAAPVVAGVAALIRVANPQLTAPEVVQILKATMTPMPSLNNKIENPGIVNAEAAVLCALNKSCLQ